MVQLCVCSVLLTFLVLGYHIQAELQCLCTKSAELSQRQCGVNPCGECCLCLPQLLAQNPMFRFCLLMSSPWGS